MTSPAREHWPEAPDLQRRLAIGAGVGAALCALGALLDVTWFFRAYLVAYLFWFGIALGSLAILLIHNLTGGQWGTMLRRVFEGATATLPLFALLFIPIALGVHHLYPWTDHEHHDAVLAEKAVYLNVPFFLARAALYFVVWLAVALALLRWSHAQEDAADPVLTRRMQLISGPGLAAYGLGITFAAVDWVMSLEPHWFSSIFGFIVAAGQGLTALAFGILALGWLARRPPLAEIVTPDVWHDLGNLLLAFVMVWTYVSFSQYLLIWSGNLPEEITWYEHRSHGGWGVLGGLLIVCNFALPFLALLMRGVKRHPRRLSQVAAAVVVFGAVHQIWLIVPSFGSAHSEQGSQPWSDHPLVWSWLIAAALAAVGGLWGWVFVRRLAAWPLVPRPEPAIVGEPHHA
ncbi:MAG: hypothetical protein L0Y71_21085 [Gemmataceae bacterium]|nr:hypothetical protein [Gemmataceae bacterium]